VLFSYPRANTPGCTAQAQGLSAAAAELAAAGYRVIGISADKPAAQGRWREKYSLAFNLLCDPGFQVLPRLGLTKTATSVLRSHLVIAKGGAVLDVQYGVSPKNSIALAREFCLAHPAEPLAPPGTAAGAADAPAGEAAPEPQAEATEGSS
jgi:thioredoxin-dependent peroxiredoxin